MKNFTFIKKFFASSAFIALLSVFSVAHAKFRVMVAVDPSDVTADKVVAETLRSSLAAAIGQEVIVVKTKDLSDAIRSTRVDEYDLYLSPAHVASSSLTHGFELIGVTAKPERLVLIGKGLDKLNGGTLYLPQQDSIGSYLAKGLVFEAGGSMRKLGKVTYARTTGAGLWALGVGLVDATVASQSEVDEWLKTNQDKAKILKTSEPVPWGLTASIRSSLPAPAKAKILVWANTNVGQVAGLTKFGAAPALSSYKYVAQFGHFTPASMDGIKRVDAREASKLMSEGATLVDVRSAKELVEKRILGAILAAYIEKSLKEEGFDAAQDKFDTSKLDVNKAYIFACNGAECWKSYKAAFAATKNGFTKVYWLRGGLPEWEASGLPVTSGAVGQVASK